MKRYTGRVYVGRVIDFIQPSVAYVVQKHGWECFRTEPSSDENAKNEKVPAWEIRFDDFYEGEDDDEAEVYEVYDEGEIDDYLDARDELSDIAREDGYTIVSADPRAPRWALKRMIERRVEPSNFDFCGADLREIDLSHADLDDVVLNGANLTGANLYRASLYHAKLRGANLSGADLRGSNLYGADLSDADLRGADLRGADLRHADLGGADLRGADLRRSRRDCTKMDGAILD